MSGTGGEIVWRGPGDVVAAGDTGFAGVVGEPIDYVPAEYLCEHGWKLLPQSARDWATQAAGDGITDPVTRVRQPYWYSNISPSPSGGPGPAGATFDLFMFGRRGLAVVAGATDQFVASPAGSRWRQTRWDVPVDGARVRHDHRHGAPPNTGGRGAGADTGPADDAAIELLPEGLRSDFGNLPLATQRFLVEPFVQSAKRPQQAELYARTRVEGGRLVETLWTYLFNARRLSFAFLERAVVVRSGHLGDQELWSSSPEAAELTRTPWDLAAFTAPVVKAAPTAELERA